MSKKVLVNLDFNGNEIQNVAMQMLATAPTSPTEGQFYYNSKDCKAYQYVRTSATGITPVTYAWKAFGAEIVVDASFIADSTNPVQSKVIKAELDKKVDKVSGKGLSTNDYTTAEKNKLAGLKQVDGLTYTSSATAVATAIKSGTTNLATANLPVASSTQAGIITKAMYDRFDKTVGMGDAVGFDTFKLTQDTKGAKVAYQDDTQTIDGSFTIAPATSSAAGVVLLDSSVTSSGTNPVTGKAIYDYVTGALSEGIAAADAMIYKGTLGTGGTVTALPTTYKTGWTYRVITAGTYAGQKCEIGDLIIALVDRAGSGNANADWTVAQTNIDGAITSISGTSPISVTGSGSSRTVAHANSGVTAGSYGLASDITPKFGDKFLVPYLTENATGHTTNASNHSVMIPNNVATVTSDGLMSKYDKNNLGVLYTNRLKEQTGEIAVGSKSTTLMMSNDWDTLISIHAYVGSEEVVVDVDDTGDGGEVVVSIAKPYTSAIDVVMVYADLT